MDACFLLPHVAFNALLGFASYKHCYTNLTSPIDDHATISLMDEGLLALFEGIKQEFLTLPLDDFTNKRQTESHKVEFWSAVSGTPLESDWKPFQNAMNTAANIGFPLPLREDAYKRLKYKVDEIIAKIKSGTVSIMKKRIADEVVNVISDLKIKKICMELNTTPDQNVLSLAQSLGEALQWTLWYRAQKVGTSITKAHDVTLAKVLDEATSKIKPFYTDNAVNRFLNDFKNNFLKSSYDMVRHDPAYIPDIVVLNPALDALEHLLRVTFP